MSFILRPFLVWLSLVDEPHPVMAVLAEPLDVCEAYPGDRVRRVQDGIEGTLTGWLRSNGALVARVVFTGEHRSWVDLVRADRLELVA